MCIYFVFSGKKSSKKKHPPGHVPRPRGRPPKNKSGLALNKPTNSAKPKRGRRRGRPPGAAKPKPPSLKDKVNALCPEVLAAKALAAKSNGHAPPSDNQKRQSPALPSEAAEVAPSSPKRRKESQDAPKEEEPKVENTTNVPKPLPQNATNGAPPPAPATNPNANTNNANSSSSSSSEGSSPPQENGPPSASPPAKDNEANPEEDSRAFWTPPPETKAVLDKVMITDVTSNMLTITVRESSTDTGFFKTAPIPILGDDVTSPLPKVEATDT